MLLFDLYISILIYNLLIAFSTVFSLCVGWESRKTAQENPSALPLSHCFCQGTTRTTTTEKKLSDTTNKRVENKTTPLSSSSPLLFFFPFLLLPMQKPAASSSALKTAAVDADLYPYQLSDAAGIDAQHQQQQLQSQQLVSSLQQLCDEVKQLSLDDHNKVVGTSELATRQDELRAMLEEHRSMLIEQKENVMVQKASEHLRKTLISAKVILKKALETSFRRGAKFKNPIRIVINDLVLANSKLGHAIALAYAKTGEPAKKMMGVKPGQEECLGGDKAYFGHGVAQDFGGALAAYKKAAEQNYPPAINSLATMYREGKGTPKDLPLAIDWYKKAAALNNLDAINKSVKMKAREKEKGSRRGAGERGVKEKRMKNEKSK